MVNGDIQQGRGTCLAVASLEHALSAAETLHYKKPHYEDALRGRFPSLAHRLSLGPEHTAFPQDNTRIIHFF